MFLAFLISLIIYICIRYHWRRRHLYAIAMKFDGPLALPIIGSTLPFIFSNTEDLLYTIFDVVDRYSCPSKFWLGPDLILIFKNPQHVKKILSSSKFTHKHNIYDLLKVFLGKGLITASGPTYKNDKKIIQPMFDLQFSENSIALFEKHFDRCAEKLENMVDKGYFDIGHIIDLYITDVIGETVLGYNFNVQIGENLKYVEAFNNLYGIVIARLCTPWLHPNIFFNMTSLGKKQQEICCILRELTEKIIDNSKERITNGSNSFVLEPIVDKIFKYKESHISSFPETELWKHLITLYMASQDTIALIVSAAILCFGMYPVYQTNVVQEIEKIIGKNSKNVTFQNIVRLTYLDMCVKDILRLFPIAPYIFRKTVEVERIDEFSLPINCGLMIPIYNLHKDPKYWVNPNHFHPDHFLPEVEKSRPSHVYIPFSAGPRSCIGKVLANISIKYILINLLQRFEFESTEKLTDIRFKMDISLRSLNGYNVIIKHRKLQSPTIL